MAILGPPNRGNDPLHIIAMAVALVAAAMLGAAIGFLLDFGTGGTQKEAPSDTGSAAAPK